MIPCPSTLCPTVPFPMIPCPAPPPQEVTWASFVQHNGSEPSADPSSDVLLAPVHIPGVDSSTPIGRLPLKCPGPYFYPPLRVLIIARHCTSVEEAVGLLQKYVNPMIGRSIERGAGGGKAGNSTIRSLDRRTIQLLPSQDASPPVPSKVVAAGGRGIGGSEARPRLTLPKDLVRRMGGGRTTQAGGAAVGAIAAGGAAAAAGGAASGGAASGGEASERAPAGGAAACGTASGAARGAAALGVPVGIAPSRAARAAAAGAVKRAAAGEEAGAAAGEEAGAAAGKEAGAAAGEEARAAAGEEAGAAGGAQTVPAPLVGELPVACPATRNPAEGGSALVGAAEGGDGVVDAAVVGAALGGGAAVDSALNGMDASPGRKRVRGSVNATDSAAQEGHGAGGAGAVTWRKPRTKRRRGPPLCDATNHLHPIPREQTAMWQELVRAGRTAISTGTSFPEGRSNAPQQYAPSALWQLCLR